MADVARRAGVSPITVSRVSNGYPGVTEATRAQVQAAMLELGYRPNSAARALKSGRFRTIGVVTFTLSTTGNMRTVDAIATAAAHAGYATTLLPVEAPTRSEVHGALTRLHELAVDAVIVIMEVRLLDHAQVTVPLGVHTVVVDSDAGDRYAVVDTDQADGARQAVEHLLALGHRTVWHVAGPDSSFAARTRARAWREVLEARGAAVPALLAGDWSPESGYRAGQVLAADPTCTAVFVANDQMALGVYRALAEAGRRVPRDVSVIGFDDVPEAAQYTPPLTTVHQDFDAVGRLCVERVIEGLAGDGHRTGTTLVPTTLAVRGSTGPPPTGPASVDQPVSQVTSRRSSARREALS
jgi:DNA-binding LacI/PurR family transcriptional regulator